VGASDFTLSFQLQRPHREWETTHFMPRSFNVFPVADRSTVTAKAWMETVHPLTADKFWGLRVDVYGSGQTQGVRGDATTNAVWGVTPPYLSNRFVGRHGALAPHSLWLRDNKTNMLYTAGAFSPFHHSDAVFKGQPNPTVNGPAFLPLYGVHAVKRFYSPFDAPHTLYEYFAARLAEDSPYHSGVVGGTLGWHRQDRRVDVSLLRAENRSGSDGLVPAPTQGMVGGAPVTWATAGGRVGKQTQTTLAVEGSRNLPNNAKVWGTLAHSRYEAGNGASDANGTLVSVGGVGKVLRGDLAVDLLSVDADYDPFVLPMPRPAGFSETNPFYEVPFFTRYPDHYFLHDSKKYPQNREGVKAQWDFPLVGLHSFGTLSLFYGNLRQKDASTVGNLTRVGFVEPLFGTRTAAGATSRGRITNWGANLNYSLPRNRRLAAAFHRYDIERATSDANNVDLKSHYVYLSYGHPLKYTLDTKVYVDAGISLVSADGAFFAVGRNVDFRQMSPFIGISYSFTQPPDVLRTVSLKLRRLSQNDRATPLLLGDFRATQIALEARWDF
jgi:hypothetical protein